MTFPLVQVFTLLGENLCWSLLGLKGLKKQQFNCGSLLKWAVEPSIYSLTQMKSSEREGKTFHWIYRDAKEGRRFFFHLNLFFLLHFQIRLDCFKFGVLVEIRHLTVRFLITPPPPPTTPLMLILAVLDGFSLHIIWKYWSIMSHIISQWALFRLVVDHWDHCRTCQYF